MTSTELATPGAAAVMPARERGTTSVADRVVAKIAAAAIGEVAHARGAARRLAGVQLGSADRPHVDAEVDGDLAIVDVTMAVTYPAPVAEIATAARGAVIARVAQLCGITVRQVDIQISALPQPAANARRLQ